jgi:2-polyprenyl-6-methoxyphenol hydroxylase-like FAD-dependent oxidoreductase
MNAGIGDACGLGSKLAAVLHGFGGPNLLPSYEIERRAVGLRNREASGHPSEVRAEIAALYLLRMPSMVTSDGTQIFDRLARLRL